MLSFIVLGGALLWMLAVMNLAWMFQKRVANSGWIDVFWTFGTGIAGAGVALLPYTGSARQLLVAGIVLLWSLRLGGYIARRVATSPEDTRYAHFRSEWGAGYQQKLWGFVLPQAGITALLCLSVQAAAQRDAPGLDIRDVLGAVILLIAIGGEALSDRQLARFKATNTQKGAICQSGLWAWSRHPNYFFEWLGWLAYPVIALDPASPLTFVTLIAPAVMYVVLRFLTGVKPLEETMLASRGDAYRAYQAQTSAFFLLPPKHGARA